jgi:hypothetical protein
LSTEFIPLTPLGATGIAPQFYTPIALNSVTPTRLIVGAGNGVFESTNRGDTVRLIGPGIIANEGGHEPIAYGAADNADALYVGADSTVFVRDAVHPDPLTASSTYPGSLVLGIVMDPNHWKTAYVVDPSHVLTTADGGATWTDLTANLQSLKPRVLRCLALVPATTPVLMVGSDKGVYARSVSATGTWARLATGLPNVPVYHLEYDAADQLLVAGTLGRGAWTIVPPPGVTVPEALVQVVPEPAATDAPPVTLAEGILVDPANATVVLMQPANASNRGAVESVHIPTGETKWVSPSGEKPIDINQGRVIAQAKAEERNGLKLTVLRGETGEEVKTQSQSLAATINASIAATPEGKFTVVARGTNDSETISWQFRSRLPQGVRPGALPTPPQLSDAPATANAAPIRIGATSGTLQFNLETGELRPLNVEAPVAAMATLATDAVAEVKLEGVEGEQVVTADGKHVAASVRTGDDTVFEKYQLSIYNKDTRNRIGGFNSHLAMPRILVTNERILVLLDPHSKTVDGREVNVPRTLKAYAMDGKEVWSRAVRDIEFRGPYPP